MGNRGFTLVEVMMAMVIFTGSLAALIAIYGSTGRLSESSRNLSQAINDARIVMEAIRNTAQNGGLTGAAGVTGVYAQGNNLATPLGLASLQNETITVTYGNVATDPLPLTLQVSWQEAGGRTRTVSLDTTVTRR